MRTALALSLLGMTVAGNAFAAGLFGMMEIKANRIDSIPKWVDVLGRIKREDLEGHCNLGSECSGEKAAWFAMMQRQAGETPYRQMDRVNNWVNDYPYITDDDLWGRSDYWATPGVFVVKSGDCEDYAITKYYTLKALGWDESDLRLVIVHDAVRDIPHAVLAVNIGGEEYILDNLSTKPLLDRYVRQYTPYYAVNARSRWVFVNMGQ